ncbi:hypothetical protein [Methylocystis sp.]|uniref:hypothetical protein n=1 Tax=Methylocystis sp. TaxID=1911079 RepID=UPI002734FC9C|nr:hypothetical protein [Methylocystis sp.]MDP3553059.1 hypothetical protein [Methylocystis sp.]
MVKKPKKLPAPFDSAESKEAFRQALRSAFAANRALIDFTENVLHDNPTAEPLDAIQKAAAAARDAEAAWAYFLRLSHNSFPEKVSLN